MLAALDYATCSRTNSAPPSACQERETEERERDRRERERECHVKRETRQEREKRERERLLQKSTSKKQPPPPPPTHPLSSRLLHTTHQPLHNTSVHPPWPLTVPFRSHEVHETCPCHHLSYLDARACEWCSSCATWGREVQRLVFRVQGSRVRG